MEATKRPLHIKQEPQNRPQYTTTDPDTDWLTVNQYADLMHCNSETIRRACERAQVPGAMKFGTLWRIPVRKGAPC